MMQHRRSSATARYDGSEQERDVIFLAATSSSQALRDLFELEKAKHRGFSLASLCKKTEMGSRGYLSDVLSGKRILHKKYRNKMAKAFALHVTHRAILDCLYEQDEANGDPINPDTLERWTSLKKSLTIRMEHNKDELLEIAFLFEVYAAFGLFHNRAMMRHLVDYFGAEQETQLTKSLSTLQKQGMVTETDGVYSLVNDFVMLQPKGNQPSATGFLASALQDAQRRMHFWFSRRQEAHFEASLISVKRRRFEETLPDIRRHLGQIKSQLETNDGDQLIRFNVQIYPTRSRL